MVAGRVGVLVGMTPAPVLLGAKQSTIISCSVRRIKGLRGHHPFEAGAGKDMGYSTEYATKDLWWLGEFGLDTSEYPAVESILHYSDNAARLSPPPPPSP